MPVFRGEGEGLDLEGTQEVGDGADFVEADSGSQDDSGFAEGGCGHAQVVLVAHALDECLSLGFLEDEAENGGGVQDQMPWGPNPRMSSTGR